MIRISQCKDHFEELVHFVARLNSEGIHHIGYFGEGEADVRASLAECQIPPAEGFLLAYDGNGLIGIFGVDADPEINRAWLYGPLVERGDWQAIGDELYNQVLKFIPEKIGNYELFCDVQNIQVQEFAARHGFSLHSENAILRLDREKYIKVAGGKSKVVPYEDAIFDNFEQLHQSLFPNAYFTARQIAEKLDDMHRLFLAYRDEQLVGFHFCKIDPEAESGYVDFIGTKESARGRGIGADLLAAGVDWMLSSPSTKKINLTVHADNSAALALYDKFGFITERIMRGYRKKIDQEG